MVVRTIVSQQYQQGSSVIIPSNIAFGIQRVGFSFAAEKQNYWRSLILFIGLLVGIYIIFLRLFSKEYKRLYL
jgi:hypothetical protein